jgi:hypothetical protein
LQKTVLTIKPNRFQIPTSHSRNILEIAYHLLAGRTTYCDVGTDYFGRSQADTLKRRTLAPAPRLPSDYHIHLHAQHLNPAFEARQLSQLKIGSLDQVPSSACSSGLLGQEAASWSYPGLVDGRQVQHATPIQPSVRPTQSAPPSASLASRPALHTAAVCKSERPIAAGKEALAREARRDTKNGASPAKAASERCYRAILH